jgi:hypothetical protein
MSKIIFSINRWFVALVSAFLIGSLPMSNHMSVQTMHMDDHVDESKVSEAAASPMVAGPGNEENHHHTSSESCCNACCPFCIFVVVQSVSAIPCGDNEKVGYSDLIIQSVYVTSITPPPKA